jgi:beta-lactamase regulating signal transducer with metallopeptidase domain
MLRISEFILNFILNSCWQIAAIAAVAALASWLLKNGPARYRHTLWLVALAACLVVPLLTTMGFVPARVFSFETVTAEIPKLRNTIPSATQGSTQGLSIDHLVTRRRIPVNTSPQSAVLLTVAYALFIFGVAIRLARFWQRKERLRRSATHAGLPPSIEVVSQRCRRIFRVRNVAVALTKQARVPYTLGARRPLILLPEAFCAGADETKLLSVIGHEMAHVARQDFLSNLICELVLLPVSFHPLTFWIKRQIDRTRELSCDELVTNHVLEPRAYARSLLWAADVSRQYSPQAFMLSIFDGKILEERIMRLTKNRRQVGAGPARVMMFAALFILCASAMSLSIFSLELQTQARAIVQPLQVAVTQDPVITVSPSRGEPQLNAPAPEARATSACDAGRRGDIEAIPKLIALLGDDSKTKFEICWDTGRWSPALQTFKHASPGEQAAIALASFGRPAYMPLSNELNSPDATVRRNAAWAIGELTNMIPGERSGAVPQLISLLSDPDEWVRMAAARALGELHDKRSVEGLVARVSDDDWRVRQLVVWALSEMKDDRVVTALCNVLLSDVRVEVRRGAAEALGEIRSAEAVPSLKQALNDAEAGVSAKAAWAISEIEG